MKSARWVNKKLDRVTYEDVLGVLGLGSGDDSGGNHKLFPGLGQIEVVDAILVALVDVGFHLLGHVLSTNVNLNQNYKSVGIRVCKSILEVDLPQRRSC